MSQTVTPLALGSGVFAVNSYRIDTGDGLVLVDTGMRKHRAALEARLRADGGEPGSLKLILITHGDMDHIGSAAYLRGEWGAPIAMHRGDVGMSVAGDMFSGRKRPNVVIRTVLSRMARLPRADRFEPDITVDEDSDLSEYGLAGATVLVLGAHSRGSIALLLADGSLICGDVLENRKRPRIGSIMNDKLAAEASVERLKTLAIGTVYPGHGRPFEFEELVHAGTSAAR